jgi:hypothetical protein
LSKWKVWSDSESDTEKPRTNKKGKMVALNEEEGPIELPAEPVELPAEPIDGMYALLNNNSLSI